MRRFFKSLDVDGLNDFIQGIITLIATGLVAYATLVFVHILLMCVVVYTGLQMASGVFGRAVIGSIYRNREGKNKDFYMGNEQYIDRRFQELYGIEL